jgi:hypothetical protein
MKINQPISRVVNAFSGESLVTGHCGGAFSKELTRTALLTVVFIQTVALATGCATTGHGIGARLISPVTNNQQPAKSQDNDTYQPARSPAFSDFFGS